MKLFFKSAFIFLLSSLFVLNVAAQNPTVETQSDYSLGGRVSDPNGSPVSGAKITVQGKFGGAEKQIITDESGAFKFESMPAGEYKIKIEASGFSTVLRDVSLKNNRVENVEIALPVGTLAEQVTVTATRTQISAENTAVPVSVVGREDIERKAVNTIGDVFRTLPGTSTVNEGAFQVRPRIRGLDSNRVLILVDGERLNNSRTSTGQSGVEIGLVETSQIESVEVVRGSGSVLYGTDALAGTINIITRDTPARRENGFRLGGTLDTFYSSNENGRRGSLAVNGSNKFFAFRLAQSLERFDNYSAGDVDGAVIDPLIAPGIAADGEVLNTQSHGGNTQATGRFFINDTNTLRLNYERRRASNIGSAGLVGTFNAFFPFSNRDKFSARYDTANLTKELSRVSVSGFYQTQYRNFSNIVTVNPVPPFFPGVYQSSETITDTKTSGFDLQTDWTLGGKNNLTAGASFFRDENNDNRTLISSTTSFSPNRTINRTKSVPDASLTNFAVFAQNEFQLTNRLKLTGGIRFDTFRTNAEPTTGFVISPLFTAAQIASLGLTNIGDGLRVKNNSVTGDFGAVYKATKNVILTARIGRSFRTPNIFERFFTDFGSVAGFLVGNPNLKPESGINFDTGVKIRTSRFNTSLTYFNSFYKNFLSSQLTTVTLVSGTRSIPVYQTVNFSRARIQGFEADFEAPIKIRLGYLTPNGNFSYLRGDDLTGGNPLNTISPFRTNAGVRWQNFAKNYFADYNARIVAKQTRLSTDFKVSNLGDEPGFVTHNLSGGYYFRRERFNFNINVGVSNLFNRFYSEQYVLAPARGRSFTVGTSWEIK